MPRELKELKQKFHLINWENLQEAMRILVIFAFLWLALYQVASAEQVLNQPEHDRTLIFEGWTGGIIKSDYSESMDRLIFSYCDGKTDTCTQIAEPIAIKDITSYNVSMLSSLKVLRQQLAHEIDSSIWSVVTGGSSSNPDIQSLDILIGDLEAGGIHKLVLMTDENSHEMSPEISSPELVERLAGSISKALGGQ